MARTRLACGRLLRTVHMKGARTTSQTSHGYLSGNDLHSCNMYMYPVPWYLSGDTSLSCAT